MEIPDKLVDKIGIEWVRAERLEAAIKQIDLLHDRIALLEASIERFVPVELHDQALCSHENFLIERHGKHCPDCSAKMYR